MNHKISSRQLIIVGVGVCGVLMAFPVMNALLTVGHPGMAAPVAASGASMAIGLAAYFTAWRRWSKVGFRKIRDRTTFALALISVIALFVNVACNIGGIAPRSFVSTMAVVAIVTIVGFVEESMFRGLLGRLFLSRRGLWIGLILSAVVFGLTHAINAIGGGQTIGDTNLQIIEATIFGAMAAAMYFASGSLWPAVTLHAVYDGIELLGNHQTTGVATVIDLAIMTLVAVMFIVYLRQHGVDPRFSEL